MLRVPLNKAYIKRTIRPLYGWSQATPQSCYLDPNFDTATDPAIYPGMVMMRTTGDLVDLIDDTGDPLGLSALYVGGDGIDEVSEVGVNVFAVWVLGPDAQFEVLAPAFDEGVSWTDPGDGTNVLVHAYESGAKRGRLCPAGTALATTKPIARLVKVNSATKITIAGLSGTVG